MSKAAPSCHAYHLTSKHPTGCLYGRYAVVPNLSGETGLNKMSIAKFETLVSSCNLRLTYRTYECVKGINWLSKVPLVRELFINNVSAVLSKVI